MLGAAVEAEVAEALRVARALDDPACLLLQGGGIALAGDDAGAAIADARQAAELHQRIQDRRGLLSASIVLAEGLLHNGQPDAAADVLTARAALLGAGDDRSLAAVR